MKLYLARHGETIWNTQKRMQGWDNSDLTEQGLEQAKLLGKSLEDIHFNQVVSSPLGRTVETAKLIVGDRDLDLVINENFKEMGFGSWEGQSPEILKKKHPDEYKNLWTRAHEYVPIDGETFKEVQDRVIIGLEQIIRDNPKGNVLLVTHGMIVQVVLLHMKGLPLDQLWHRGVVHPSSLSLIEIEDDLINIIKEADISHLE